MFGRFKFEGLFNI